MASQPLNTTIKVHRTLRSQRGGLRHESVKALTSFQRKLELQVPGQERPEVYALTRDNNTGVSSYDKSGRPIVIGARAVKDFEVIESLTGFNTGKVEFPTEIGHDKFVSNTTAGLASDAVGANLHGQAQTL